MAFSAALDSPHAEQWTLCLLGNPRLHAAASGRQVALSPKDAALMALVALQGPLQGARAATLIWPAATLQQAEASLRQRLFRLRRQTGSPLVGAGALLQLSPEVSTDLEQALQALAADPLAAQSGLLGDLGFEALPELNDWLAGERQRWCARRDDVLAEAAARHERQGELARALAFAQRLAEADPLAEHAQRRLMRLHYLRGDRASAIAVFERLERRLKDELGTRPAAETIELMATVEQGATHLPARRALAPASLLRPPRLVGREQELAAMAHAWAGQRVVLLLGEAGAGKSRLLQEFAARRAGVVSVQARPGDAGISYALLARLLRALRAEHAAAFAAARADELALVLPELGEPVALSGPAQRVLLQRVVGTLLASATGQGLEGLLLDDLHFADAASLECLQALLPSESLVALHWGLAQRPAEGVHAAAAWRQALEEAGRVDTLALQLLDLTQLTALVESLGLPDLDAARLAPALLRHTGGNPLFVLETLKDLVLSGETSLALNGGGLPRPVAVGTLVQRRLDQLSAPALRLARVAALAGRDFSAELAAAVLGQHPLDLAEPWRELESAQVIREGAFAHDLIFEATRASVPQQIAQLLHGQMADHLQQRGAPPESLAPHRAGAAQWLQAGEAHAAAARRAHAASQRTHEVAHWQQAAAAFEKAGAPEQAFEARCESIPSLIVVQGVTHANQVITELLAAARSAPERVAALTARATAALMSADHEAGITAAAQAGELARGFASPWPGLQAARLHAVGLAQAGRTEQALAILEPFRALVEAEGSTMQRGSFWGDYAYVLNGARRLRDTGHALEQAIVHAQALGDLAELATLTSNLATVRGNLGQVPEALALARRSLSLQAQLGGTDGPEGAVVETYLGLYCAMVGRYAEALQRLDAALDCFRRDQQVLWVAVASNHKAQCLIDLGQLARAQQALAYEPPAIGHVRARGATIACRLARAQGQTGQAELQQALQLLTPGADPHVRMHVLLQAAQQAAPPEAVAHCEEVLALAETLEFAGVAMKARLLLADALRRGGRTAEAAALLHPCVPQLAELLPADFALGQAWWLAVQVFEEAGEPGPALAALRQGVHWVREVAGPHVPPAFQASFMERNASHRALLAAASRARPLW